MMRHPIPYGSTKPTPLNFEEICPIWSNKLKADLDQDDLHILIRKPEMCIVGEAWGYTSRYLGYRAVYLIPFIGCWKCIKYGNKIGKKMQNSIMNYVDAIFNLQLMILLIIGMKSIRIAAPQHRIDRWLNQKGHERTLVVQLNK